MMVLIALVLLIGSAPAGAQQPAVPAVSEHPDRLQLTDAVICEGVEEHIPINPAVVFSLNIGKVACYTFFDPVPISTHIFHNWYYRDRLSRRAKLSIRSPRWATISSIQLREADKGPWRVEITDAAGRVLKILRFSISD